MRFLALVFLALVAAANAADWTPPAANQGAWLPGTNVGVDGGIEQYLAGGVNDRAVTGNVINVTQAPYNADNTGASDVSTAVASAITAAVAGDVIYFPAGTYHFDSTTYIPSSKSGITIRGAGPASTTFVASTGDPSTFMTTSEYSGGTDIDQTVTGTKTKGTTELSVSSSADFAEGNMVFVLVENEWDNTRITAGAAPTWSNSGFRNLRTVTARVTAVSTGVVTIDPGLPWDCTNYTVVLRRPQLTNVTTGVGFEDFAISFDAADHPLTGLQLNTAQNCWVYNVHCTNWGRSAASANGQVINIQKSYKFEVRKCRGVIDDPATFGDDGFIQVYSSTSGLIVDNIIVGWDNGVYEFGKTYNTVIAYNLIDASEGVIHHNSHTSLVLTEGNWVSALKSDGYHGSASHNTYYRNHISGEFDGANWPMVSLNRFTRYAVMAGNVVGEDGRIAASFSMGNPNIGNGFNTGTAEASTGDFWADWGMTGTLTTRTSDTAGVITVSGGDFEASTGGSDRLISAYWGDGTTSRIQMTLSSRTGLALTVTGGSGTAFPAEGTTFTDVWVFTQGYQERDLDVENYTTFVENYESAAVGTGSVTNGTADTLPASLAYAAKPAWFGSLAWPPYDPDSPSFSETRIPAGYRYVNGNENYLGASSGVTINGTLTVTGTITLE